MSAMYVTGVLSVVSSPLIWFGAGWVLKADDYLNYGNTRLGMRYAAVGLVSVWASPALFVATAIIASQISYL